MNQVTQNKPSILLVDDRPENLLILQEILGTTDQNLVMAKSGKEALKKILEKDFAAILLDFNEYFLCNLSVSVVNKNPVIDHSRSTSGIF